MPRKSPFNKKRAEKGRANAAKGKVFERSIEVSEFIDREVAWLKFNDRVLAQVYDANVPLLERVGFLKIFHSNLDEFFMKRLGRLRDQAMYGGTHHRFLSVRSIAQDLFKRAAEAYKEQIKPKLSENGIQLLNWNNLSAAEKEHCQQIFKTKIFPVLTPLAVDPGHPFPHISNLSTSIAVSLRYPGREQIYFSRMKHPAFFAEWYKLDEFSDDKVTKFVRISDIILNNLQSLFPNMEIVASMLFRVTRNIELERNEEGAEDLLEMVTQEIKERRFGEVVKLEVPPQPNPWLLNFLISELEITENDIYIMTEEIDFGHLSSIAALRRPELKFKPWVPMTHSELEVDNNHFFETIAEKDILLHHPFDSFASSVERFITIAAEDPNVLAIKMTLYRTNEDSRFMRALIRAAERGKQVVCLVELKARFDEERNISWAAQLEEAGVHVVYGIVGLKIHSKIALIVRSEHAGIRCYAHIGTGNYNSITSNFYTDFGLITTNPGITEELVELFHHLTGRSAKKDYQHLLVAPYTLKPKMIEMIQREAANAKKGLPSGIIIKINNLEDHDICNTLFEASQAGVPIELIVRSICTLTPGRPKVSENIKVTAIVDRFLEHSRIFYFRNGAAQANEGQFFFGSADLMYRNLLARVEVITPVLLQEHKDRIWQILRIYLTQAKQAWFLKPDGVYHKKTADGEANILSAQEKLMKLTKENLWKDEPK
jgi:polyphosphate kinase